MQSNATTVEGYLNDLPEERREPIENVRKVLLANLPMGFEESMQYGMLSYVVPHSRYPAGYHVDPKQALPFISLASQKNYIALYHMGLSAGHSLEWFLAEWPRHSPKKLDMGKSCIRFKKPEDIPLDLIATLAARISVDDWIAVYEKSRP